MAEAAGLALGGIALVGMMSTCMEILEYIESAQSLARDFRLAVTKVGLIKRRLSDWGQAMCLDMSPSPGSYHTTAPTSTCPTDCVALIEETLWGIRLLLETTGRMSLRHSLGGQANHLHGLYGGHTFFYCLALVRVFPSPLSRLASSSPPSSVASFSSISTSAEPSFASSRPRRRPVLAVLRLRLIWVFQDKKKFESVINELAFLLDNLEKISEPVQTRHRMALNSSRQRPVYSGRRPDDHNYRQGSSDPRFPPTTEMDIDREEGAKNNSWIDTLPGMVSQMPGESPQRHHATSRDLVPYVGARPEHAHGVSPSLHSDTTDHGERRKVSGTAVAHRFQNNESLGHSVHFQGDIGEITHHVQGHDFESNRSHDTSMMMAGSINMNVIEQVLRDRKIPNQKSKASDKSTEKVAGGRMVGAMPGAGLPLRKSEGGVRKAAGSRMKK